GKTYGIQCAEAMYIVFRLFSEEYMHLVQHFSSLEPQIVELYKEWVVPRLEKIPRRINTARYYLFLVPTVFIFVKGVLLVRNCTARSVLICCFLHLNIS